MYAITCTCLALISAIHCCQVIRAGGGWAFHRASSPLLSSFVFWPLPITFTLSTCLLLLVPSFLFSFLCLSTSSLSFSRLLLDHNPTPESSCWRSAAPVLPAQPVAVPSCSRQHDHHGKLISFQSVAGSLLTCQDLRVGNKYRIGRKIGSGSFGDIYLGASSTLYNGNWQGWEF